MPNKTCSRKQSFSSNAPARSSLKRSNGASWLPAATDAWTYSMKLWRSMRRSTTRTRTTLIVWEDWSKSGKSLAWSMLSSVKSWWFLTVRRRRRDSSTTHRTRSSIKLTIIWEEDPKVQSGRCLICLIFQVHSRIVELLSKLPKKTRVVGVTLPIFLTELSQKLSYINLQNAS